MEVYLRFTTLGVCLYGFSTERTRERVLHALCTVEVSHQREGTRLTHIAAPVVVCRLEEMLMQMRQAFSYAPCFSLIRLSFSSRGGRAAKGNQFRSERPSSYGPSRHSSFHDSSFCASQQASIHTFGSCAANMTQSALFWVPCRGHVHDRTPLAAVCGRRVPKVSL